LTTLGTAILIIHRRERELILLFIIEDKINFIA